MFPIAVFLDRNSYAAVLGFCVISADPRLGGIVQDTAWVNLGWAV